MAHPAPPSTEEMPIINPFLIESVLARIFHYLDDGVEVVKCRLVCRLWDQFATRRLRDSQLLDDIQLNFHVLLPEEAAENSPNLEEELQYLESVQISKLQDYITYINTAPSIIRLTNFSFRNMNLETEGVQTFLDQCGSHIKTLALELEEKRAGTALQRQTYFQSNLASLKAILLHQCGNLERLQIGGYQFPGAITSLIGPALLSPEDLTPPLGQGPPTPTTRIKSLTLLPSGSGGGVDLVFIRDLLLLCPLLEELTLNKPLNRGSVLALENVKLLFVLETSNRLENLRALTLDQTDVDVIGKLSSFGSLLTLHHFKIGLLLLPLDDADAANGTSSLLLAFLESQSPQLISLELALTRVVGDNNDDGPPPGITGHEVSLLPASCPKLTFLSLTLPSTSARASSLRMAPNFYRYNLAAQTPALSTLIIHSPQDNRGNADFLQLFNSSSGPMPSIHTVRLPPCIPPQLFPTLKRVFPRLRHFWVGYQPPGGIRLVWSTWPKLESLFLSAHPPPWMDLEEEDEERNGEMGLESLLLGAGEVEEQFSIINLKKLRQLTLHGGWDEGHGFTSYPNSTSRNKILVGDASFVHAFAILTSLQYLNITVENEVSYNLAQVRSSCPWLKLRYAPDRDFLHLESEDFHGRPHSTFNFRH